MLTEPDIENDDEVLRRAIDAWTSAGPPTAQDVADAVRAGSWEDRLAFSAEVAVSLVLNGSLDAAELLIDDVLGDPDAGPRTLNQIGRAVCQWGSAEAASHVLRVIEQHPQGGIRGVVAAAGHTRRVVPASVLPGTLQLVEDPAAAPTDAKDATRVLIVAGPEWAARGVAAFIRRPAGSDSDLVAIARALIKDGHGDLARRVSLLVLGSPTASAADRDGVGALLCDSGDPTDGELLVATILKSPWLGPADRLGTAVLVTERGRGDLGRPIVRAVVGDPTAEPETVLAALMRLDPVDFPSVRVQMEGGPIDATPAEQLQRRRIQAWLSVS